MDETASAESLSPERQIELLHARLAQVQRLSAVGELAGTITHEFNNVLMTIINYAKLGMRHKDEATRDKALEKILNAGTRAARITSSVLALSRNRSSHVEPTDLARLIDDTLLLMERDLNKYRIAVDRQIATHVPPALVNCGQIQQVLVNLLTNARQAMPGGGRIAIRLAYDPAAQTVDLVIRDNGCGIPADKLPKIFERFYSTKQGPDSSGTGGTGLGLSLCREIIEAHQGRLRVESAVGRGTSFTLKLPADVSAATKAPTASQTPAARSPAPWPTPAPTR